MDEFKSKNNTKLINFRDYFLSIVIGLLYVLIVITFPLFLAFTYRPFYYCQISIQNLPESSGYSYLEIKNAFDELMDSLIFNEEFSLGVFPYSEEGMNHFLDCKGLFLLSNVTLVVSSLLFFILLIVIKYKKIKLRKLFNLSFYSWFSILLVIVVGSFAIYAIADFYGAFNLFHTILFPGKSNWVFDPVTDPIINVLPTEIWINYGIILGVLYLFFILLPIIKDIIEVRKKKRLSLQGNM